MNRSFHGCFLDIITFEGLFLFILSQLSYKTLPYQCFNPQVPWRENGMKFCANRVVVIVNCRTRAHFFFLFWLFHIFTSLVSKNMYLSYVVPNIYVSRIILVDGSPLLMRNFYLAWIFSSEFYLIAINRSVLYLRLANPLNELIFGFTLQLRLVQMCHLQ